jgi:hypothetical protein
MKRNVLITGNHYTERSAGEVVAALGDACPEISIETLLFPEELTIKFMSRVAAHCRGLTDRLGSGTAGALVIANAGLHKGPSQNGLSQVQTMEAALALGYGLTPYATDLQPRTGGASEFTYGILTLNGMGVQPFANNIANIVQGVQHG